MIRLLRIAATSILLLAVAASVTCAATFTYSFDKSLGFTRLNRGNTNTEYDFDLGRQFSNIDSITMRLAGFIDPGSPTTTASVYQILFAKKGTDKLGAGIGPGLIAFGSFDSSYTFTDQIPHWTEWRQYVCANKLDATLLVPDTFSNPNGYVYITTASMTIVGTPVPEPSSILAILGGLAGIIWRKSKR